MKNYAQRKPRQPRAGKWDHVTKPMLQELYEEGLTTGEMAERLGMPRGTLAWMLAKYELTTAHTGEPKRRRKPRPPSPKPAENGQKGQPKGAITPELRDIAMTAEQEQTIRRLYKRVPRREIAQRLQLDKVALNMMIIKLGLGS